MKLHCQGIATTGLDVLFVLFGVLVYATSGLRKGATGLPIGPRAPDADTGVSIDRQVYSRDGTLVYHGDVDGTSKYSHLGKNPKPAVVDGPIFVETKVNLDSGVMPKPGDPSITGQRRLVALEDNKKSTDRLIIVHRIEKRSDLQRGPHKVRSEAESLLAADKGRTGGDRPAQGAGKRES